MWFSPVHRCAGSAAPLCLNTPKSSIATAKPSMTLLVLMNAVCCSCMDACGTGYAVGSKCSQQRDI